ncbi:MAG: hypothetical protein KA059_00900 [Elusimicrobiales bacterium]|jgi:hypothetical protein|nr:hypothetical protein [Elusimicrobiales bacterium]
MKKFKAVIMCIIFAALPLLAEEDVKDPYQNLANDIGKYAQGVNKIAVIPFSYADNTQSTKDGSVIAERLSMKLINMNKFEVIERTQLDKVLSELKLQNSGVIDAQSAKELGKVLGVDAIITGTLIPTSDGRIEVNARIVKTDTAQAIGATQSYVVKDWIGGELVKTPVYTSPTHQQTYTPTNSSSRQDYGNAYSFFDLIAGFGTEKIDVEWDNGVKQSDLDASGSGPIGLRIGGFGNGVVGGDFEIAFSKFNTDRQVDPSNSLPILPKNYIEATSFELGGDVLFRTNTKIDLYLGLGLGLTINTIKSTTIRDNKNALLDETDVGLLYRIPVGLRFNTSGMTFFAEYRYEVNSTWFDRGNANESNNLTLNGSRFVFGIGGRF